MKTKRVHSCNVLQVTAENRQLWQFQFDEGRPNLQAEYVSPSSEPLPGNSAVKDWRALWQPKVNIAWLPSDQVFLRVVQLPASEYSELLAMVELQLEKLSPLPVAQVVWGIEVIPTFDEPAPAYVGTGTHANGHAENDLVKAVVAEALRSSKAPATELPAAGPGVGQPEGLAALADDLTGATAPDSPALVLPDRPAVKPIDPTSLGAARPEAEEAAAPLQTVVVIIIARSLVEEFLGSLEGFGYLADRLEFPLLHQLLASRTGADGIWLVPGSVAGQNLCLMGWWETGVLRNLNLLRVSTSEHWAAIVRDQLTQIAWAGEMEGWVTEAPKGYLLAEPATAATWEPVLRQWLEESVAVVPPLPPGSLAAWNAQRVARGEPSANLLPPEFAVRYQQQFVDGLWMGGLLGIAAVYVLILLVYFGIVQVYSFRQHQVGKEVAALSNSYTNALRLKARVQVLQDQSTLRFAALECWKAATLLLPQDITLTDLNLQYGKTLLLAGTVPQDQVGQVLEYSKALSLYRVGGTNGTPLFSRVNSYKSSTIPGPGGVMTIKWDFTSELQRTEVE